jgi:hypothetical protein
MTITANRGSSSATRPWPDYRPAILCRRCDITLTKGLLLHNSIWISPIPPDRSLARRLQLWLLGGCVQKHKVHAWRCPACGRLELIAK